MIDFGAEKGKTDITDGLVAQTVQRIEASLSGRDK